MSVLASIDLLVLFMSVWLHGITAGASHEYNGIIWLVGASDECIGIIWLAGAPHECFGIIWLAGAPHECIGFMGLQLVHPMSVLASFD